MSSILLSVKPEYVEKILKGDKKYEFRKRIAVKDVQYIYLYSTAPVMKVVAKVEVIGTLQASPIDLWEKTKEAAGISRKKYRAYFQKCKKAYAYILGNVSKYNVPKTLDEFGVCSPPQSFVYIDGE